MKRAVDNALLRAFIRFEDLAPTHDDLNWYIFLVSDVKALLQMFQDHSIGPQTALQ